MLYKCQEIDEKCEMERNRLIKTSNQTDKMLKQFLFDKGQRSDKLIQIYLNPLLKRSAIMAEMKIGYSGNYPFVEINFFLNEEGENYSIKLPMSKMWYKDIIYEIEKVAEEEKKKAEKYLHEDNRKMMTHCFDMYAKLIEIGKELRRDIEMDSEGVTLSEASAGY